MWLGIFYELLLWVWGDIDNISIPDAHIALAPGMGSIKQVLEGCDSNRDVDILGQPLLVEPEKGSPVLSILGNREAKQEAHAPHVLTHGFGQVF